MLRNPIAWRGMKDINKDKEVIQSSLDLVSTRHAMTLARCSPWGNPGLMQAEAPSPLLSPTGTSSGHAPCSWQQRRFGNKNNRLVKKNSRTDLPMHAAACRAHCLSCGEWMKNRKSFQTYTYKIKNEESENIWLNGNIS